MKLLTSLLTFIALILAIASSPLISAHDVLDLSSWDSMNLVQAKQRTEQDKITFNRVRSDLFTNTKQHLHHIERIQKSKITCTECLSIAGILQDISKSKSTQNLTIDILDSQVCQKLAKKSPTDVKLCKDVVALAFRTVVPAIFNGLKSLAWDIPQTLCSSILPVCKNPCCKDAPTVPQQLHLSFVNTSDWVSAVGVTWTTQVETPGAFVRYGSLSDATVQTSDEALPTRTYSWSGWVGRIHYAKMTNLKPATEYWYQVGNDQYGWSQNYTFLTLSQNVGQASDPLKIISIADMGFGGNSNDTLTSMMNYMQTNKKNNNSACVINFPGDIGYADGDANHNDLFLQKFEPLFARCIMMFTRGNHESTWDNSTSYNHRLAYNQPQAGFGAPEDALYTHQTIGTAKIVIFDSETAFDTSDIDKTQVRWATDVMNASPKTSQRPWLIATHHRPLYCTEHGAQCKLFADILKSQVEDLYYEKKVDIVTSGHIHTKLVSYPTYKGVATQKNYTEPTAPVYVIHGNAGNREGNRNPSSTESWFNYGYNAIGFSVMEFSSQGNQHSLAVTGYESSTGKQLDQIVIKKTL